jgi:RimJ/RimL family protein N-acetyltransferase
MCGMELKVELIEGTVELLDADGAGPGALAAAMGARVAEDWPPEHHDAGAREWLRDLAADASRRGWGMRYIVSDGVVVGTCGYHGPPEEGVVEIGYSVVGSHRRRGIATAAIAQLVATAWERGVETVAATTHPELAPSIGVLEKLGFERLPASRPGVVSFALRRPSS